MKIKHLTSALCFSIVLTGAAFAQSTGDNTSGGMGTAPGTAADQKAKTAALPAKDGVTMYKDTVYVVKNGTVEKVTKKVEVADGLVVDKMSITKNGQKVTLTEGQMMTFDGNLIEAPRDIMDRASQTGQGAVTTKP